MKNLLFLFILGIFLATGLHAKAGPCGIPVYTDPYAAFSIGKPSGWKVTLSDGGIMVTKDPGQTIGVMVFPARLKASYSTQQLFNLFASAIGSAIKKSGGTFQLSHPFDRGGGTVGALATASAEGQTFLAPIWVETEPGFVTLKLYFSPKDRFAKEEPMLKQVAGCFHRQTYISAGAKPGLTRQPMVAALRPYQSAFFRAMLPQNWQVAGESQSGIDLAPPDHTAGVSFAYLTSIPNVSAGNFIAQMLPRAFSSLNVLRRSPLPSPYQGWDAASVEFEGTSAEGRRVHGISVAEVLNGMGGAYALLYIKTATPDRWRIMLPLLSKIEESLAITQGSVSSQINEQNRRFQNLESHIEADENAENASIMGSWAYRSHVQDVAAQKYENALLGWEQVRSPSTGETYDAPMDAWWSTGPEGPGYYRQMPGAGNDYEKLQQVTP